VASADFFVNWEGSRQEGSLGDAATAEGCADVVRDGVEGNAFYDLGNYADDAGGVELCIIMFIIFIVNLVK
jgi:hypothetical protein